MKKVATYSGIALFTLFVGYHLIFADRRSTLKIDREKITISTVKRDIFQEFIPQTGTVEPSRTVYLDAVEGGTIKRVVAESGAMVKQGDVILELSNLNRELAVLQQEASLNQSINEARNTRLGITQNDLQQRQELAQIDNQLAILAPQYERQKQLFEKKLIARQDFEKTEADYNYYRQRREITYEVYQNDSVNRIRQLAQMNYSESKMIESLEGVGKILDNLVIRAPIDGQLSHPPLDAGQAVTTGITDLFVAALQVAGPLIVVLFLADAGLGLLTRVAPALNAFALGFPLKILLTITLSVVAYLALPQIVASLTDDAMGTVMEVGR